MTTVKIDSQDLLDLAVRIINEVVTDVALNPQLYLCDPGKFDEEERKEYEDAGEPPIYGEQYYELEDWIRQIIKEEIDMGDTDNTWHEYEVKEMNGE